MKNMRWYAAAYKHYGWSVIPLAVRAKHPRAFRNADTQKYTGIAWKAYQQRHATEEELDTWFHAPGNLGIVTGDISNRLLVVDWDRSDLFIAWFEQTGIETLAATTGKGLHLYFRLAEGETLTNKDFYFQETHAGELRYNGGYVVAPPSVHPNGSPYQWTWKESMATIHFEQLHLEVKEDTPAPSAPQPQTHTTGQGAASLIPGYVKNPVAYAKTALQGEMENILNATIGQRNRTVFNAAWKLRKYAELLEMSDMDIYNTCFDAARQRGFDASFTRDAVIKTLHSALSY